MVALANYFQGVRCIIIVTADIDYKSPCFFEYQGAAVGVLGTIVKRRKTQYIKRIKSQYRVRTRFRYQIEHLAGIFLLYIIAVTRNFKSEIEIFKCIGNAALFIYEFLGEIDRKRKGVAQLESVDLRCKAYWQMIFQVIWTVSIFAAKIGSTNGTK